MSSNTELPGQCSGARVHNAENIDELESHAENLASQSTKTTMTAPARVVKKCRRVPSIRVKGSAVLGLPSMVIRGRRGRKGEEVKQVNMNEEWTDAEPPITISYTSSTDFDLDAPEAKATITKFDQVNDFQTFYDSDDDIDPEFGGWEQWWYSFEFPVTESIEGNFGLSDSNGSGESSSKLVREAFSTCRQTNKAVESLEDMPAEKEAEERERSTVVIDSDSSEQSGKEFALRKRVRSDEAENHHNKRDPCQKVNPHGISIGRVANKPKNGQSHRGEMVQADFWALDPRTRVLELKKMFHRRKKAEEEMLNATEGNRIRADLKAYSYLEKTLIPVKGITSFYGQVPGTEVGDYYFYRAELILVGLHRQIQSGIDYIASSASKEKFVDSGGKPLAVAVSVVSSQSGRYDNRHEGETLTYVGQGPSNADQKLERGNLALKNSCDLGLCVRVIRKVDVEKKDTPTSFGGSPGTCSPSGSLYIYDGIYKVERCYKEIQPRKGHRGFKVWKFTLIRQPGQTPVVDHLRGLG
ncbi:hypothetical protein R1flu_013789 [Riccia fluitans]|uniref:YDG domain-containing protein n=1 Tax=Riccia fluitans TaxID=41844 RepID=A0ABD1YE84_9MARC